MYLRSLIILSDELQDPKNREEFEAKLVPLFDEEVDKYRREKKLSYLNQDAIEEVSGRVARRFTDSIIKRKF